MKSKVARSIRREKNPDVFVAFPRSPFQGVEYYEFIVVPYRARWQRLGAELQIDWIEGGSPAAPRAEINIVFLMPGIIVRVELYEGWAGRGPLRSDRGSHSRPFFQ